MENGFIAGIVQWILENPYETAAGLVFGLLVTIVSWILSIPQKILTFVIQKFLAKKRRLANEIKAFEGNVELVDKRKLSQCALPKRVQQFYEGAMLNWDIIAARADIERDKQEEVLQILLSDEQLLRMVFITGEPGSGKSTFAWRIVAELHLRNHSLVLRVKRADDPQVWFRISEFCAHVKQHVYVLADDLLRYEEVVQALRQLDPSLCMTILATSQTAEYHPHRLTCQPCQIDIVAPSDDEKARMLKKIGMSYQDLTFDQQIRLDKATDFRILMLELTTGSSHTEAIIETVRKLERVSHIAFEAYKYICFCYQYEISIPSGVLELLNPQGKFYQIGQRPELQGLVFQEETHPKYLRTGHSRTATIAFSVYHQAPKIVLTDIIRAIEKNQSEHRSFILHLILRILSVDKSVILATLSNIAPTLSLLYKEADSIREALYWHSIFHDVKMVTEMRACENAMLGMLPKNSSECTKLVRILRQIGRAHEALPILLRYANDNYETGGMRPVLLNLVEYHGTTNQVNDAVLDTRKWINDHPEDTSVRAAFLGLVEKKAPQLVPEVIEETGKWLKNHPKNYSVRTPFLGLVERKAPQSVPEVVEETRKWLKDYPGDSYVRAAFLGLVERKAPQSVPEVVEETRKWLKDHPEDSNVRAAFLGLVERKAPQRVPEVINETRKWLKDHPEDSNIRAAFLGLVDRLGTELDFDNMTQDLRKVIAEMQDEDALLHLFSVVIGVKRLENSFETDLREIVDKFGLSSILYTLGHDTRRMVFLANWLRDHNYPEDSRYVYESILSLSQAQTSKWILQQTYYGYGRLYLNIAIFGRAIRLFRKTLGLRKRHIAARIGLADALKELGKKARQKGRLNTSDRCFEKSKYELEHALDLARTEGQPVGHIFGKIGWLYIWWGKNNLALQMFGNANEQHEGEHYSNYWGEGQALMTLGFFKQAEAALTKSFQIAPDELNSTSKDEISQLLIKCRSQLKHDDTKADTS